MTTTLASNPNIKIKRETNDSAMEQRKKVTPIIYAKIYTELYF